MVKPQWTVCVITQFQENPCLSHCAALLANVTMTRDDQRVLLRTETIPCAQPNPVCAWQGQALALGSDAGGEKTRFGTGNPHPAEPDLDLLTHRQGFGLPGSGPPGCVVQHRACMPVGERVQTRDRPREQRRGDIRAAPVPTHGPRTARARLDVSTAAELRIPMHDGRGLPEATLELRVPTSDCHRPVSCYIPACPVWG
jgi:hypothetical protein